MYIVYLYYCSEVHHLYH